METVFRNLVRYLAGQKLIEHGKVVDGGLTLAMSRSRNRYVMVKQREGPGFFVKQAMASEAMSVQTVAREAEIYRGAFGDDRLQSLRALLPDFHHYDPDQGILITEMVADAENLAQCHQRLGACPPDLARRLGVALAACHCVRFAEGRPQAALFPQAPPWILTLHSQRDVSSLRRSAAASLLVDRLIEAPGLGDRLATLRESWRRDTLIHTDMRWENCLLAPRTAPIEARRLYIVDWELADIGDAAWDVGGMLQSYLGFWAGSIPAGDEELAAETAASRAERPIETIQPAVAAFWTGYIEASEAYRGEAGAFLDRCVRMMAARMLVTAFEMSVWSERADGRALLLLRTALDTLAAPAEAARDLLGLDIREGAAARAAVPPRRAQGRRS